MNITRRGFVSSVAGLAAMQFAGKIGLAEEPAGAKKDAAPAMFGGPIEAVRLEDDLYALLGAGGNVVVHFNTDRILVIDSGVPDRAADLLATVTKFSPGAARKTLLNTHWHFDHVGGNGAFSSAGYNIVGSTTCRARLNATINLADLGMVVPPLPEPALPKLTFDDTITLYEPTAVRLTKVAPSHTDTDVISFFDQYNVLMPGDLVFAGFFPVIDRATGGSLDGMIKASEMLLTIGDDKTRVVPGHGAIGDKSAVSEQLSLLKLTRDRLAPFGERKATLDEVLTAKPLADLDDKWGRGFLRSPIFTRMAYGQWLPE